MHLTLPSLLPDHLLVHRADNGSSSHQGSFAAASAGITGGYEGNSTTLRIVIAFLLGLSLYNAVELTLLVFATFVRFHGTYFYSLLIATLGVLPYSTGFILKFFKVTDGDSKWLAVTLITIGWYAMVTGQSVVLWSRLHLILVGRNADTILKWTKWMIIINVVILHVPTTVLTYGCNGSVQVMGFVKAFQVYEKIQMVGFWYTTPSQSFPDPSTNTPPSLQELLLSSIYILHTLRILRSSQDIDSAHGTSSFTNPKANSKTSNLARKILWQLFTINVLIIAMDVLLLGFEFANLYIMEASFKGVVYSVKLKLEFAVLGKLVLLVKRERSASTAALNGNGNSTSYRTGHGNKTARQYSLAVNSDNSGNKNKEDVELMHSGAAQGIGKAVNGGLQCIPPRVPTTIHEMRTDSAQSTEISAVDSTESPRRTATPKSVRASEDAVFEHYEKVLDM